MKPVIDKTGFGSITIDSVSFKHDVIIRLDGTVEKRKRFPAKMFGGSHTLTPEEAEYIHEEGARHVIIGTGQFGVLKLSPEAEACFADKGCEVLLLPTPQAINRWNDREENTIGLFHVTC
jgi:hypothetical protein